MKKSFTIRLTTALAAAALMSSSAYADVTLNLNVGFGSGNNATLAAETLQAVFTDVSGGVDLTLSTAGMQQPGIPGEADYVTAWYFNFNPSKYSLLSSLSFAETASSGPTGSTFQAPTIATGVDAYQADGDGTYDISLAFGSPNGQANRFSAGDSVTYLITTHSGSISASDFNFPSNPHQDFSGYPGTEVGPYYTAADISGYPFISGYSWIGAPVPEPTTIIAGALMLLPFGASTLRFVRRNRAA